MLGKITLRTKALIGIAVACAGYIVLMPDTSQTIEPTHAASAPSHGAGTSRTAAPGAAAPSRAIHPAQAGRKSPVMNASFAATVSSRDAVLVAHLECTRKPAGHDTLVFRPASRPARHAGGTRDRIGSALLRGDRRSVIKWD